MCTDYNRSLAFWTTSFYYLKLVESVADQMVIQENKYVIVSDRDSPISPEDYEEQTKWSDHNISVPLLYNFYHGVELLLKGFMLLTNTAQNPKLDHNIEQWLDKFKAQFCKETELITILEKYVSSNPDIEPLKSFSNSNSITPNMLYQALRYPYDKKFNKFWHLDLKYKGSDGVNFYRDLINDIRRLRQLSVILGRSFDPKAP